jgi:hypothetical protein
MKIFLKDYKLSKLHDKIKLLEPYLVNISEYYEGFSKEGCFLMDSSNIYKLLHQYKPLKIIEKYLHNFTIMVDYSNTIKKKENQIPVDTEVILVKKIQYSIDKKSKMKLIIHTSSNLHDVKILDFYFEIDEEVDLNNMFIKNELNVFLSCLN